MMSRFLRVRLGAGAGLSTAYLVAMVLSTVSTVLGAWFLTVPEFAALTAGLILCALPPLLFAWGLPDALTFDWLRGRQEQLGGASAFSSAVVATLLLSTPAFALTLVLATRAGLGTVGIASTGVLVITAMCGSILQAVELAREEVARVCCFVLLAGSGNLVATVGVLTLGSRSGEYLLAARALGALMVLAIRLCVDARLITSARPRLGVIRSLFRHGTAMHGTAVLAAGAVRLEQLFAVEFFSDQQLAIYGLAMPVVAGVRQVLYGVGTGSAVALAKTETATVAAVGGATRKILPVAVLFGLLGWLALVAFLLVTDRLDPGTLAVLLLLVISGVAGGVLDVVVRLLRAVGGTTRALWGRAAATVVTVLVGPWLYASGLGWSALVGLLAFVAALVAITSLARATMRGKPA